MGKKEAIVAKGEKKVGDLQTRIDDIKDRIFADFSREVCLVLPSVLAQLFSRSGKMT